MVQVATMAISFGRRLKTLRERAGLTQEQLARKADVSTSFLSKLEQKDHDPSWTTVQSLAKALGVSTDEFATDDDDEGGAETPAPKKPKGGKGRK
jgi:transcriptional regulator with XRE-family HTH domain